MSRVSAVIAAFALLLLSSVGALAEESIKTATANEVAEILKGAGYRAEIVSSTRRPYVRTGIGGHNVVVLMFDCKAEACSGIQFWTGIKKTDKFTVSFVEGWNAARRLAKFHLTKDGDLHVEYDIDLSGGVSPDYIKQAALLYERLLARMDEYIKGGSLGSGCRNRQQGQGSRHICWCRKILGSRRCAGRRHDFSLANGAADPSPRALGGSTGRWLWHVQTA